MANGPLYEVETEEAKEEARPRRSTRQKETLQPQLATNIAFNKRTLRPGITNWAQLKQRLQQGLKLQLDLG